MSGHCKDCKWWGDFGECLNSKLSLDSENEYYALWPADSDAAFGGVKTGPDFGCIHFEQKVESTQ